MQKEMSFISAQDVHMTRMELGKISSQNGITPSQMPNELQGLAQLEEMSIACVSQCFLFIQNQVGKNLKHKKAIVLTFLKIHY